ncbi:MAG: phosphoribosylanthranilate isomerase [Planctomycetia bacterium]
MRPRGDRVFHVKICGVTTPEDAGMVAAAGADAIGLNFVTGSPRLLDLPRAQEVAAAIPAGVLRVGVFAGATVAEMLRIAAVLALDAIQLHGHLDGTTEPVDPPERCRALAGLPVIRAVRLDGSRPDADALTAARQWIAAAAAAGRAPAMVIVDAAVSRAAAPGRLGGTGERVDWAALARAGSLAVPMAVAGGLTPENVAEAIRITGLLAVDTASGVEAAPGRKDPMKVRDFVAAARGAMGMIR